MASIKLSSQTVIQACDKYTKTYNKWRNSYTGDESDDSAWIEIQCKSNNANTVQWIRRMAQTVYDTQYPYVNLTYEDYILIGKYLVKHEEN